MKVWALYGDITLATQNFNAGVQAAKEQMAGLKKDMTGLQEEADSTGTVLDNAFGHALGDILSGITQAAIETAFTFATEGVELAASAKEIQNVVDTTFGDATASQINAWAKTTKNAYGIGALSAKEYASTMGATLKGMGVPTDDLYEMSTALVGLAGDMASFRNLDTATTFRKIMSGMTGEMEPLKELGIIMSATNLQAHALTMGITGEWSKLDSATQTQVRYNYLMQQTADMHGDFAETSGSYSNQMRLMQENIEQLKLSVGESLLPVLNNLVGWFNSLFGGSEDASAGLDAIKEAATDSIVSIETTTTNALSLVKALEDLEAAGEEAGSGETWNAILKELETTLPGIGDLIEAETGTITGGTAALREYVAQWRATSMELAQQQVVQDMYDEYAAMRAEIAKLQTEQQIADARKAGAQSGMDELEQAVMGYVLAGMESMGVSDSAIQYMSQSGMGTLENLIYRSSKEGANAGRIFDALFTYDNKRYKSFETYFKAGGGSMEVLESLLDLYAGYRETYEKYDIDNSDAIEERQALLADQEAEIQLLQQIMTKMGELGTGDTNVEVRVELDGEQVTGAVLKRVTRDTKTKSLTTA